MDENLRQNVDEKMDETWMKQLNEKQANMDESFG